MTLPRDELERVAGAMYAALEQTRAYFDRAQRSRSYAPSRQGRDDALDALEAIDGALADAGELVGLNGVLRGADRAR